MKGKNGNNTAGQKILFVCRHNEMRSSTAETIYREEGFNVRSAGADMSSRVPMSLGLL